MARYQVRSLPVGHSEIPGPELLWMRAWDEWVPLTFQVVLIRSGSVVALVNTGPGPDLTELNAGWESFLGPRAAMRRSDDELLLPQLLAQGVRPEDVTHIIVTPLQLYTVGDLLSFPNATICISRRGWTHFHTTHHHPHDDRWTSIPEPVLVELVTSAWPRVLLLEDEHEIAPGLRAWWSGGHHRASVVVEVETDRGTVAVSDTFFHRRNVFDPHPIGIAENIYECLACYRRVRESAQIVVPLYDPANFECFPDGVIA